MPEPTSLGLIVVVDPERLHRVLRRVTDDLNVLRSYAEMGAEAVLADPARLGHVKYLFVTALEGCIDAAHHVSASEGFALARTNADAMLVLAAHGVLDPCIAQAMAQAVRFRNLLVHGYADVDDRRVVSYLDRLKDLDAFVVALATLLNG